MPAAAAQAPSETTEIHTRILRLALGIEDSRRYWEHVDPEKPVADRATLAFEQRWFGAKSLERVRYLLGAFGERFDRYPAALGVLHRWRAMDVASRQVICQWHLQLSDPLHRRFTGEYLVERRRLPDARVDRAAVIRWVKLVYPDRWSEATVVQFASKLLSAALEAGLVSKRDPRLLSLPKVTDTALAYLLYLLRQTRQSGSLTSNAYLASVGIDEDLLLARSRGLPGVTIRRMSSLVEIEWDHRDLTSWARELVQ